MLDVGNLLLSEGEHGAKGVSVVIESFAGGHGQLFEKDENPHGCLHGNLHLHKHDLSVWAVLVWRVAADDALLGVSLEVLVVDDKESEVCKGLVLPFLLASMSSRTVSPFGVLEQISIQDIACACTKKHPYTVDVA